MKLAAIEYLRDEMKISVETLLRMEIVRIWKPAKLNQKSFNMIWIEFAHESSVFTCYGNTFRLKPNHRLIMYTPRQFYNRVKHVVNLAYNLRNGDQNLKTRIKFGISDILLLTRPNNFSSWTNVTLNNLPPIEMNKTQISASPPTGRNRQSKRQLSEESNEVDDNRKNIRLEVAMLDNSDDDINDLENKVDEDPSPNPLPSTKPASPEDPSANPLPSTKPPSPGSLPNPSLDLGSFKPSSCLSPAVSSGINFTFGPNPDNLKSCVKDLNKEHLNC